MRSLLAPFLLGCTCVIFLSACGSDQSSISGDFTVFGDDASDVTLEVGYWSQTLGEEVILVSTALEYDTVDVRFSFDYEIPRMGFVELSSTIESMQRSVFQQVVLEKNTQYEVEVKFPSELWFTVSSSGTYAHLFEQHVDRETEYQKTFIQLTELLDELYADAPPNALPLNNDETIQDRVPSVHAAVLDWANMECSDYAGEYETFWEKRPSFDVPRQEPDEVVELREKLNEIADSRFEQMSQSFLEILTNSSDPVEKLLILDFGAVDLELEDRIAMWEEMEPQFSEEVVQELIARPLIFLRDRQERLQASDALKLGTFIPAFELELKDNAMIEFSELLRENQVVVLEFWHNHCIWCINAMRDYTEFYEEFSDLGLEVVSVSIEPERDDWVNRTEELEFPWVNTLAPGGYDGHVAKEFGVRHPRRNFVLNSDGCIMKRDLTPDELLDFLTARLRS